MDVPKTDTVTYCLCVCRWWLVTVDCRSLPVSKMHRSGSSLDTLHTWFTVEKKLQTTYSRPGQMCQEWPQQIMWENFHFTRLQLRTNLSEIDSLYYTRAGASFHSFTQHIIYCFSLKFTGSVSEFEIKMDSYTIITSKILILITSGTEIFPHFKSYHWILWWSHAMCDLDWIWAPRIMGLVLGDLF